MASTHALPYPPSALFCSSISPPGDLSVSRACDPEKYPSPVTPDDIPLPYAITAYIISVGILSSHNTSMAPSL